jgi:hypothetical protein
MENMSTKQTRALKQERKRLAKELGKLSGMVRGTFFERFSTCSRPKCKCRTGERHGPRSYVAVTQGKKQAQRYVPQGQVEAVMAGVDQFHRLLEIADRLTRINLELMHRRELDEGRR